MNLAHITKAQENLKHVRDWLDKQPHLMVVADDEWLLRFLRGCKFSLQRTKDKLDMFYTMRTLIPEYFKDRDPVLCEVQDFLEQGYVILLPENLDASHPRTLIIRIGSANNEKFPITIAIKVLSMILDLLLLESEDLVVKGLQIFLDLQDISHKCKMQLVPSMLKKIAVIFQEMYPIKVKQICLINCPRCLETALPLLKFFVPRCINSRIHIYNGNCLFQLKKCIPLYALPEEYGGEGCSINDMTGELILKLKTYRDWFLKENFYSSDETKRLGKSKTGLEMFGNEDSFRKIDLDFQEYIIMCKTKT